MAKQLFKKSNIFHSFGDGVLWQPYTIPSEPYLMSMMPRYRTIKELETINLYDKIDYKPVVENLNELRVVSNQYLSNIVGAI